MKATAEVKKELQRQLGESINDGEPVKEIISTAQDYMKKHSIPEHEVVVMVSESVHQRALVRLDVPLQFVMLSPLFLVWVGWDVRTNVNAT